MSYKEKYLKYKKKYVDLKKNFNYVGGKIVNEDHELPIPSMFEDNYNLVLYHGTIDKNIGNSFTTPANVYLIVANCCGASNFESSYDFYKGIQNDPMSTSIISKDELRAKIKSGLIKNPGGGSEYVVLEPNSDMCEINLITNNNDNIAKGRYILNYDLPFQDNLNSHFKSERFIDNAIKKIRFLQTTLKPESRNKDTIIKIGERIFEEEYLRFVIDNKYFIKFYNGFIEYKNLLSLSLFVFSINRFINVVDDVVIKEPFGTNVDIVIKLFCYLFFTDEIIAQLNTIDITPHFESINQGLFNSKLQKLKDDIETVELRDTIRDMTRRINAKIDDLEEIITKDYRIIEKLENELSSTPVDNPRHNEIIKQLEKYDNIGATIEELREDIKKIEAELQSRKLIEILNRVTINEGNNEIIKNNKYFKTFYNAYIENTSNTFNDILNFYLQTIINNNDIPLFRDDEIDTLLHTEKIFLFAKFFDFLFLIELAKTHKLSNVLSEISNVETTKLKIVYLQSCLNVTKLGKKICASENCYKLMSSIDYGIGPIITDPTNNIMLAGHLNANNNLLTLIHYNFKDKGIDPDELCYKYFRHLNTNDDDFKKYFKKTPILSPNDIAHKYYFTEEYSNFSSRFSSDFNGPSLRKYNFEMYSKIIIFVFLLMISTRIKDNILYNIFGEFIMDRHRIARVNRLYYGEMNCDDINMIFSNLLKKDNFSYHSLIMDIYHQHYKNIDLIINTVDLYANFYAIFKKHTLIDTINKEIIRTSFSSTQTNLKTIEQIIKINELDRNILRNETIENIIGNKETNEIFNIFYRQLTKYFKFVYYNYDSFHLNFNSLVIYSNNEVELRYMNSYVHHSDLDGIFNDLLKLYIEPLLKLL